MNTRREFLKYAGFSTASSAQIIKSKTMNKELIQKVQQDLQALHDKLDCSKDDYMIADVRKRLAKNIKRLELPSTEEAPLQEVREDKIPLRLQETYTTAHVIEKLLWATEYLLHQKNYDGHSHEELKHCTILAKEILKAIHERHKAIVENQVREVRDKEEIIEYLKKLIPLAKRELQAAEEIVCHEAPSLNRLIQKLESLCNISSTPQPASNETPVKELERLKKIWYSRNPVHENNLSTGEDMFWETLLMVIKDFINISFREVSPGIK